MSKNSDSIQGKDLTLQGMLDYSSFLKIGMFRLDGCKLKDKLFRPLIISDNNTEQLEQIVRIVWIEQTVFRRFWGLKRCSIS